MRKQEGFTLIELLVVIAIIGLLSSIVLASLNSARDKARFSQVVSTMKSMEQAAILDYDDYNSYAPDVSPAVNTRFVPKYLPSWPTPPCSGWTYDWENWSGGNVIRISLRRADLAPVYYYCIYDTTGTCGGGADIKTVSPRTLTCKE